MMTDKKDSDRNCNIFVLYIVTVLSDSILGHHVFFLNSLPVLKGAMSAGEHARRGFANYFQLSKFYLIFDIFYSKKYQNVSSQTPSIIPEILVQFCRLRL